MIQNHNYSKLQKQLLILRFYQYTLWKTVEMNTKTGRSKLKSYNEFNEQIQLDINPVPNKSIQHRMQIVA